MPAPECRPPPRAATLQETTSRSTQSAQTPIQFVLSPFGPLLSTPDTNFRNSDGAHSMKPKQIWDDTLGSALVEFTVTLPLFLLLTFGLLQAEVAAHTQAGLQHGVEVAARCASVNYSANQLNLSQSCFTGSGGTPTPNLASSITLRAGISRHMRRRIPGASVRPCPPLTLLSRVR